MFISPAYAQAATTAAGPSGATAFLIQTAPFVAIFAIFYFLVIRPQQRTAASQRAKLDAVKKGDSIVTSGGIIGRVVRVDDAQVEVEIAPNVRVKVVKAMLAEVTAPGTAKPAND
jgi:preprotein translocase subunit YajC